MPKVTAEFRKVVYLSVKGEGGSVGRLPDDGGLSHEFRKWLWDTPSRKGWRRRTRV